MAKYTKNVNFLYVKKITVPFWFYQTNGKKVKFQKQFLILETNDKAMDVVFGANFLFGKEIKYLCFKNNDIVLKNGSSVPFLK